MQAPKCPKCKSDRNMTQLLYSWVCEICDPPKGTMPMPSTGGDLVIESNRPRRRDDDSTEKFVYVDYGAAPLGIGAMIADELARWDTETQPTTDVNRVDCGECHNVDDELGECMVCFKGVSDFSDKENDNSKWYSKLSGYWVLLAVVLLALVGCVNPVTDRGIALTADQMDKSTDLFIETAAWKLGVDFSDVNVHWAEPQSCPQSPHMNALIYRDNCYWGLTFACDEIYVLARPGHSFVETAILHELGHCFWRKTTGRYDSAHVEVELWDKIEDLGIWFGEQGW